MGDETQTVPEVPTTPGPLTDPPEVEEGDDQEAGEGADPDEVVEGDDAEAPEDAEGDAA